MYFPTDQKIEEFRKHQEDFLPFTSQYLGRSNLDVGCGNGITSIVHNQELGISPTLCDIKDMRHPLAKSLPFFLIKNKKLPFKGRLFDSSYIQYVLHHLPTSEAVRNLLKEASRVSKRVIIVEEIRGKKTNLEKAKQFDEETNRRIYPNEKMCVFKYYTAADIENFLHKLNYSLVFHKVISRGDERTGFLESHVFVGE